MSEMVNQRRSPQVERHEATMRLAAMATRAADDLERPMTAEEIVNSSPVYKAQQRKMRPMAEGCLDYFPDAFAAVAHCSWTATQ